MDKTIKILFGAFLVGVMLGTSHFPAFAESDGAGSPAATLVSKENPQASAMEDKKVQQAMPQAKHQVEAAPAEPVAPPEPPQKKLIDRILSGEVGAKSPNGFDLVYKRDEVKRSSKSVWFPFEAQMDLMGYKSVNDIEEGDHVRASYVEAEDNSLRVLKGIMLLNKAPKEPGEEEQPKAEAPKVQKSEPKPIEKTVEVENEEKTAPQTEEAQVKIKKVIE